MKLSVYLCSPSCCVAHCACLSGLLPSAPPTARPAPPPATSRPPRRTATGTSPTTTTAPGQAAGQGGDQLGFAVCVLSTRADLIDTVPSVVSRYNIYCAGPGPASPPTCSSLRCLVRAGRPRPRPGCTGAPCPARPAPAAS